MKKIVFILLFALSACGRNEGATNSSLLIVKGIISVGNGNARYEIRDMKKY